MKLHFIFKEALQALRTNLLRSMLTIIGIVVGIFSVTAMLALGEGLSSNILDRFDSFVAGDITVSGELTESDLNWIKDQKYVAAVMASQNIGGTTVLVGENDFNPSISTAVGDYETVKGYTIVSGDVYDFSNFEFSEPVAIVDEGFAARVLEESGVVISEGKVVTISGQRFTVIGVIEGGTGGFGRRSDGNILIPYKAALGVITNTSLFSSLAVDLVEQEHYEIAGQAILESLNTSRYAARDSEDYFSVTSAQDAIESAQETTQMISLFLGIVGSIALFVGGIGTMNMMLTTVTERTKEIGLRKAIGARDNDIMAQILTEAVILTTFGGAVGIALTIGLSKVANQFLGESNIIKIIVNMEVVLLAAFVSFAVGVVFGIYPARNAAKLQPVDALRSD